MTRVLFLSVWYPHRYDAMAGLFVRKHALAVSQFAEVTVLYLHEDDRISKNEIIDQTTETIREIYVYYPKSRFSLIAYRSAFQAGWQYVVQNYGRPNLTHVNVLGKQALSAYRLYKKYNIPYVVTEHWSGYMAENSEYHGVARKCVVETIVRHARCIMPVSEHLALCMQGHGIRGNYCVVRNVVDDFFYSDPTVVLPSKTVRLLHVSCFDDKAKNVSGLLQAVALLRKKRADFTLTLVGTGRDFTFCRNIAQELGLSEICRFTGELPPAQVAERMHQSDVFVLSSNFETAGVVLQEAQAVGLPIVATRVGGIPEIVSDKEGILVAPRDINALADALDTMCNTFMQYDKAHIRARGKEYSFAAIGKQIHNIYKVSVQPR